VGTGSFVGAFAKPEIKVFWPQFCTHGKNCFTIDVSLETLQFWVVDFYYDQWNRLSFVYNLTNVTDSSQIRLKFISRFIFIGSSNFMKGCREYQIQ
jgi:hypothetical protein